MFTKLNRGQSRFLNFVFRFLLLFVITGCGATPTPVPSAVPTPKPPPTVSISVSHVSQTPKGEGVANVQEGEGVAIVIEIEPYETLDWTWNVSGTSGGTLNVKKGENVIYTAGNAGVDIVVAEATTADGTVIKKSVTINVEAAAAEAPPITDTPPVSGVTLTSLQNGQKVPCENIVSGTYPPDLEGYIWPIVYVSSRYYLQDEGGKSAQKVGGEWYQTVRFGNCTNPKADVGKQFQLIIVTANESANAEFEEYIKNAQVTGDWGGMMELPSGIKEQVRIVVTRE